MNRAQRRANNATIEMFTEEQVRAIVRKSNTEVLHKLADNYSAVVAMCLRDRLGFGHKRARRFLASVTDMFNDLQDGIITMNDLKTTLKDEIGVIIK